MMFCQLGSQLFQFMIFTKTSHHVLPTGEPAPIPVHVYPLSEFVLSPKPNHTLQTGEPAPVSVHVYPLSEPMLPPKPNRVLPTSKPAPVPVHVYPVFYQPANQFLFRFMFIP